MSAIMESPATSTLHPPVTNVSQNTHTNPYLSSSPVTVATFETRDGDVDLADSEASTNRSGDTKDKAGFYISCINKYIYDLEHTTLSLNVTSFLTSQVCQSLVHVFSTTMVSYIPTT